MKHSVTKEGRNELQARLEVTSLMESTATPAPSFSGFFLGLKSVLAETWLCEPGVFLPGESISPFAPVLNRHWHLPRSQAIHLASTGSLSARNGNPVSGA
jgi:hypothetical protein